MERLRVGVFALIAAAMIAVLLYLVPLEQPWIEFVVIVLGFVALWIISLIEKRRGKVPYEESQSPQGDVMKATPTPNVPAGLAVASNLVFNDTFSSLNKSVWAPVWFADGARPNGPQGAAMKAANVSIGAGGLHLTMAADGTGALVSSNPSDGVAGHTGYAITHGYVEFSVTLPSAANGQIANWPAVWLTGQSWPTTGEIDVMEGMGGSSAWHFHFGTATNAQQYGQTIDAKPGARTFGVSWTPTEITFVYDGHVVGQINENVTSAPLYIVLENNSGAPSVEPATMIVHYVRVWQ